MLAEGKPGFFAIASAPGSDPSSIELLIKSQPGSASEGIAALPVGSALMVSAAQGKGFPLDKILPEDIDIVLMVSFKGRANLHLLLSSPFGRSPFPFFQCFICCRLSWLGCLRQGGLGACV